jgi:3-(methylthio)propionyl---CoA ligase
LGVMSERPLLVSAIIADAAIYHRATEIVSRTVEGTIHRYTHAEAERRSKRLARAPLRLGISLGDRIGALAWNTFRHFELLLRHLGHNLPHTATGKLMKTRLSEMFRDHRLPDR